MPNPNVETHFAQIPHADIQRSILDMSHKHSTSFDFGQVIPIEVREVLPGDSWQLTTRKKVRLQTLLAPVYGSAWLDEYWFFVPNRLVWDHWQEFCGENTQSAWAPETQYTIPKMKSPEGGFKPGTLADYFGWPLNKEFSAGPRIPSALPARGYALIMNEFFRYTATTDPLNIPKGDAYQQGSNGDDYINDVANAGMPFVASKFSDYFTRCTPSPQYGESPLIPVGGMFHGGEYPVYTSNQRHDGSGFTLRADIIGRDYNRGFAFTPDNAQLVGTGNQAYDFQNGMDPVNLYTSIPDQEIGTGAFDINALRLAFASQRFLEKMAMGGSRYTEILRSFFGVVSPDARLQRPEFLGGSRTPLEIQQVTNVAQSNVDYLGDLGAMSVTADVNGQFVKSFTEHGYLFGLVVARYDHDYSSQGLERFWMRNTRWDMYWPTFAHLGNQPVYTNELYFDEATQDTVFGYQEAWADYRHANNRVSGMLRPELNTGLKSWTFADNYQSAPVLGDEWIREDKSNVDRTLAVTSNLAPQLFADFWFDMKATRPMPLFSVPGLIDHF